MAKSDGQTLFIGGGNMARAILKGYRGDRGDMSAIAIVDPFANIDDIAELGVRRHYRDCDEIPDEVIFETVVLATKPQVFEEACQPVVRVLSEDAVVISIMAGISSLRIIRTIGSGAPVVRCMPNMAAAVQRSVNIAFSTDAAVKARFEALFKGSGPVIWVGQEDDIHAATAVSGSGPAYFFAFVEAMGRAGEAAGLDSELALDLAIDTLIGAGELLKKDRAPARLRESVTSKGGTTAAALEAFATNNNLNALVMQAVSAAQARSKEM